MQEGTNLCGYNRKHLKFHCVAFEKVSWLVMLRESDETQKYNLWAQFRALIFTALGTINLLAPEFYI
jgi:hypothetical protein